MFFDLEGVLPLVHSIVSVWRVHTQLVSCFIPSGVPRGGADMSVSRGPLGWNEIFSPVLQHHVLHDSSDTIHLFVMCF